MKKCATESKEPRELTVVQRKVALRVCSANHTVSADAFLEIVGLAPIDLLVKYSQVIEKGEKLQGR